MSLSRKVSRKTKTFLRVARRNGLLYAVAIVVQQLLRAAKIPPSVFFFDKLHVMALPVPERPELLPVRPRGLDVFVLDGPEAAVPEQVGAQTADWLRANPIFRERLGRGDVGYIATYKSEYAGCVWIARESYREEETPGIEARFRWADHHRVVWDYNNFVSEPYRLTPVYAALWQEALRDLQASGVEWSLSTILAPNLYSFDVHKHMDLREIGTLVFWNLLGVHFCLDGLQHRLRVEWPRRVFEIFVPPVEHVLGAGPGAETEDTQP